MAKFTESLVAAKKWMMPVSAYSLLATAFVLRFVGRPELAVPLLIAVAFIILPLVFEMYQKVTVTEQGCTFRHFNEASPHIRKSILDYVTNKRGARIRCLGVSLRNYWQFFESVLSELLRDQRAPNLTIEITMLDPEWSGVDYFRAPDQRDHAKANYKSVLAFLKQHQRLIEQNGWTFRFSCYGHIPHLYGILLGDAILFQGAMVWDDSGNLTGGLSLVERYESTGSSSGREKITEFIGWFSNSAKGHRFPRATPEKDAEPIQEKLAS